MSFTIAIISVNMSAKAIVERFKKGSAGITNGSYYGYMVREVSERGPYDLRFEPVASMGYASNEIVSVLEGELWTRAGFHPYLLRFFKPGDGEITTKKKEFPSKEAARKAFENRRNNSL
jgi:hypothetical protein